MRRLRLCISADSHSPASIRSYHHFMSTTESILAAAAQNDLKKVAALLDGDPELVNAADTKDLTLLHQAARDGNLRLATLLINRGADMDATDAEHRASPLNWAAFFGRTAIVDLLLDAGADPHQKNAHGLIPRQCAEHGKAGHWKEAAPHAGAQDYQAIIELFDKYCDECATESGF